MCKTCGCGDPEIVPVDVHARILSGNEAVARHNREHFEARGVLAVNLMGSPGSGKTALLEATARSLSGRRSLAAMSGDLARVPTAIAGGNDTLTSLTRQGFPAEQAMAAATELELMGYLRRAPGGRFEVVP